MEKITLFNSLGRKKELFQPIVQGKVGIYCCGPTVYGYAHLGNLRTYLFEDTLRRVFEYNGYEVNHVMNITDVGHLTSNEDIGDDKVEMSAKKTGQTVWDIVKLYTEAFTYDLKQLNILQPNFMPKATDHINEQIEMVEQLEKAGYAYKTSDGIYFDVSKWSEYGKLSGQKLEDKMGGARVAVADEKRNAADFALWKFSSAAEKRQMEWKSPWSDHGFPGWHIECSAMSQKYLGKHFDVHCGGVDHIAVHHENEIAQSEAANKQKYVNYWMHGEFMTIDGKRMGKSEGNAFLLKDLMAKNYLPLAFRFLNFNTHYRIQLNFTWEAVESANTALIKLYNAVLELKSKIEPTVVNLDYKNKFLSAINNDLNMSVATSLVWLLLKSDLPEGEKLATLYDFDKVLGLNLLTIDKKDIESSQAVDQAGFSSDILNILNLRLAARKDKNFAESDRLRDELLKLGYQVKDGPNGQELIKVA